MTASGSDSTMSSGVRQSWPWALALLLVGVLVQLLLVPYEPTLYPDSTTYLQAAKDLVSGDFSLGQGRRTPGYPLLILAAGGSAHSVMRLQMLAGLATGLLVFWLTLRLTGHPKLAFVSGLLHFVCLQQLFQQAMISTEGIAAFSTIATIALFVALLGPIREGRVGAAGLVALGVFATWALMVRPQFIFFVGLLPLGVAWQAWRGGRSRVGAGTLAACVAVPAVALILGWCAVQQSKTGYFTLSTQSGFGMVNHPIDYIELAPERYATVRDILVRTREQRMREVGHSRNTIWYAWPEIQRTTGWSLPEASRQLSAMCKELFIAYPGRYARSVFTAWVDFWTVPIFWSPEVYAPGVRAALEGLWWVEHKLLRLANLAFVLCAGAALLLPAVRHRLRWDLPLTVIATSVLASSVIQALADQGASSRYHLPTQSLVVMFVLVAAFRWFERPSAATAR